MVHRSMKDDLRVADKLYIKRVLLALEGFLFFSLYSFSCIAKQVTTLKQLRLLSCLDFLETNLERFVFSFDITFELPISPTPDLARYRCGREISARWSLVRRYSGVLIDELDFIANFYTGQILFHETETVTNSTGVKLPSCPSWLSAMLSFFF